LTLDESKAWVVVYLERAGQISIGKNYQRGKTSGLEETLAEMVTCGIPYVTNLVASREVNP
jgi:hypothetical protein